jgi:translocation and assembly module TamB
MFSKPAIRMPSVSVQFPARRPSRWKRRLLLVIVLLAAGAWFAPFIASQTGLHNRAAREALADFRGSVEIGSASLGWFSAVELRDVVVKDAQGRTLLAAPKITSTKSLADLLRDRSDLGEFAIEQPVIEIICTNGSSNLEESITSFLKDESPPAPSRTAISVKVSGGTIVLYDAGSQSKFESVNASIRVPASRDEAVALGVRTTSSGGTLAAEISLGDKNTARLTAGAWPLEAISPFVKRAEPTTTVAGKLTTDLKLAWSHDDKRLSASVDGTASVRDLNLGGSWLQGDRLKLAAAELPIKAEVIGRKIRVERADLKCDVGALSAAGSFNADEPSDKLFDQPGVKFNGEIDLAKLATLLPKLLRVRDGTTIREGKVVLNLASQTTPNGTMWDGSVRTSALKAERGGKPIDWPEPLTVEFTGRVPAGHLPTFDKLVCRSDFIAINAKGSPESFRGAANVYLDRLSARLGEFVDLRGAKLAGEAAAWVVASRAPDGPFKCDGGIELKQFAFTDGTHRGINEPALSLKASAAGLWPPHGSIRVDSGSLTITAGPDTAEIKLLEPIPDVRQPASGKLSTKITGDLGRWMARVRGFVRIPAYNFGGQTTAMGSVRFDRDLIAVDRLTIGIEGARFRGAGLDLDEPRLDASAALTIQSSAIEFANFRIASQVLNLADGKLTIETPADGNSAVSGGGQVITDLSRLGRTLKLQSDPKGSDALHGRGSGPIRFRWQGDATTFAGTLDVRDFAYGDSKTTGISEAQLKLDIDARYDQTPDRLTLNHAKVERSGLAVDAKGFLAKFDSSLDVALGGTIAYDLAKLSPELRTSLGGNFQAAGQGSRPFTVSGSLGSGTLFAKLNAGAGLGWDSIQAYGFDVGKSEFTVKLAGGQAVISPIYATFGGGKCGIEPSLRLDPQPAELVFARRPIIDRAKLTPAVCASALGYALPVIANSAQASGEISAAIDDNHIPLADMKKAVVKGRLVVHKATIGPGPIIAEIMKLTGSTSTTMTLANDMTVPVRIEGGRVYHENLAVTVNGYTIKTSGSVGFDGSLSMVADVPIPGTLPGLKNNPVLKKAVEGKIVKVPLAGTVAKPVVDHAAFQAAVASLAKDAMKGIGKDLLNKELERLFPVPKK